MGKGKREKVKSGNRRHDAAYERSGTRFYTVRGTVSSDDQGARERDLDRLLPAHCISRAVYDQVPDSRMPQICSLFLGIGSRAPAGRPYGSPADELL